MTDDALRRVVEYTRHDSDCHAARFEAGEPTPDGGYRMKYAGKWYVVSAGEKPKCTCGLDGVLAAMDKAPEGAPTASPASRIEFCKRPGCGHTNEVHGPNEQCRGVHVSFEGIVTQDAGAPCSCPGFLGAPPAVVHCAGCVGHLRVARTETQAPVCPGIAPAPPALSGEERSVLGNLALPAMYEAGMPAEKREVIRSLLARTGKPLDRTKEAT